MPVQSSQGKRRPELQKAASALQDAATALKNGSPTTINRGNAPSPVKG